MLYILQIWLQDQQGGDDVIPPNANIVFEVVFLEKNQ